MECLHFVCAVGDSIKDPPVNTTTVEHEPESGTVPSAPCIIYSVNLTYIYWVGQQKLISGSVSAHPL